MVHLISQDAPDGRYLEARFLDVTEEVAYRKEVRRYGQQARRSLEVDSNPFKILLLNQMGIRTATFPELDCARKDGLNVLGIYVDMPAVILRGLGDGSAPEDYLANNLASKLRITDFNTPLAIEGLGIAEDPNSFYGLNFQVTGRTRVIPAPDFDMKNYGRNFLTIDHDYSVVFGSGSRTLVPRGNSISRFSWMSGLNDFSFIDFADSHDSGRIVVVAEAA